jgi:hypothetical protein
MVGTKARSSYKKGRKRHFSGQPRYKNNEVSHVSDSTSCHEMSQRTEDEFDPSGEIIVGTSRKKIRRGSKSMDSEFKVEQNSQEYRLISLNCLSSAVSNIQHLCGEGILSDICNIFLPN